MSLEFIAPRPLLQFILPPESETQTAPTTWKTDAEPAPAAQKPVPLVWLQHNHVLTVNDARRLITKEKQKLERYLSDWHKEGRAYLVVRKINDLKREIGSLRAQKNTCHNADERSLYELAIKEAEENLVRLEQSVIFYRYKTSAVIKTQLEYDEMKTAIEGALQWLNFHLLNLDFYCADDKMVYEPNPLPFVWYNSESLPKNPPSPDKTA